MMVIKKKLMLTSSSDGCIVIAEVDDGHQKVKGESFVSEDFLKVNSDKFVDMTGKIGWQGRIYVLKSDCSPVFDSV
ncbi:MAG: hypothetical protein CL833_07260 [Crocinitomicaceae bacterium]|nr:hypothetical protein [Crocinitomicaceae bacterium]